MTIKASFSARTLVGVSLCFASGVALSLGAACGGSGDEESQAGPCEGSDPPAGCGDACGPDNPCPPLLFCGVDGTCTAECTPGEAGACGKGKTCSGEGRCVAGPDIVLGTGGGAGAYDGGERPIDPADLEAFQNASCAGWSAEPEPLSAELMLVVDDSGSMSRATATTNGMSKWEVTTEALKSALAGLPGTTPVGMLIYPYQDGGESTVERDPSACVFFDPMVPVAPLSAAGSPQRSALNRYLDGIGGRLHADNYGTPTHDAYDYALAELAGSSFAGSKFMLLITDGQPTYSQNCVGDGMTANPVDEQPIIDAIAAASAQGIKTFVIGSPGSEENVSTGADSRGWLSMAAEEGGTASAGCAHTGPNYCHFDMVEEPDFGAGLERALGQIAGQIVACDYSLPTPPSDQTLELDSVNVVYTTGDGDLRLLLRDDAADCDVGWHYTQNNTHVELCTDSCAAVKADEQARLELLFGCATGEIPEIQ